MEKNLLKLCEPRRNPSEYSSLGLVFFLKIVSWVQPDSADSPLRPTTVITCYLSATTQSSLFLCLLLSLHVLRCLSFVWPNDVVMGRLLDITPPPQTRRGACKTVCEPAERCTWILCLASHFSFKTHPVWLHICGEPKPFSVSFFSNMSLGNVLLCSGEN